MRYENRRCPEAPPGAGRSRWKLLPLAVALAAACTARPVLARNDGISSNRPEDNGIYWHGVGGFGIGAVGWAGSRCLDVPWYYAVPGTLGSALALGLLREVAQHDWHLTRHQLAEGLSWGAGSAIGLGAGFTFEWGTRKIVRSNLPRDRLGAPWHARDPGPRYGPSANATIESPGAMPPRP
jgi:hypothetical protein